MKAIWLSFKQMLRCAERDRMIYAVIPAPLLCAAVLYYAIPAAEEMLDERWKVGRIFQPYMGLLYILMLSVPAILFSYTAVMIVLDELDEGTAKYLCCTPLERSGYVLSRFAVANGFAAIYTFWLGIFFPLAKFPAYVIGEIAIMFGGIGMIIALAVTALAENKVEGMALMKLSGLLLLGLAVPYFVRGNYYYAGMILPTFWIAELARIAELNGKSNTLITEPAAASIAFLLIGVWSVLFYKRFVRKLI